MCVFLFISYLTCAYHSMYILRWVSGDQYLVTVSAKERIIMQWHHDADDAAAVDLTEAQSMDLDPVLVEAALGDQAGLALAEVADTSGAAEGLGSESQAAKPWLSAIVEPSDAPSSDPSEPPCSPSLTRIFGIQVQGLTYSFFIFISFHFLYFIHLTGDNAHAIIHRLTLFLSYHTLSSFHRWPRPRTA